MAVEAQQSLFLSLRETCRLLGVGRSKLYELVGSGKIKTIKIGARRLIARDELERFVATLQATAE